MIKRNIPNTITCLNLVFGCLAVIAAMQGSALMWANMTGYAWAYIFIGVAAVMDFCDGLAARLLHAYSNLGKELDSLCDLVSFGVAPAMLVFQVMREGNGIPWLPYFAIFIAVMGALRLARFNIDDSQTTSFVGLPIPANAIFWIGATAWVRQIGYPGDIVMLVLTVAVALLMVCNIRMFSLKFKNFNWRENFRRYVLIVGAVAFVLTQGLAGLAWTIILYLCISLLGRKDIA